MLNPSNKRKKCNTCGEIKRWEDFSASKFGTPQSNCKPCKAAKMARHREKKVYSQRPAGYKELSFRERVASDQRGKCGACDKLLSSPYYLRLCYSVIDKVYEVLCDRCYLMNSKERYYWGDWYERKKTKSVDDA